MLNDSGNCASFWLEMKGEQGGSAPLQARAILPVSVGGNPNNEIESFQHLVDLALAK